MKEAEREFHGESDFHILYRSIPLLLRSLSCIRIIKVIGLRWNN